MRLWKMYTAIIKQHCTAAGGGTKDLAYWRNNLFAGIIIYLLPFSLIALIPGLYWSAFTNQYILMLTDIVAVVSILIIGFAPGLAIIVRKIIFIACFYLFGLVLIYYIGLSGPGLLYLQAASVFGILIFSSAKKYWSAFINTAICLLLFAALKFQLLPWPQDQRDSPYAWIAVSSNLVFLNFLLAALIPRLFNDLQETIMSENQLLQQLSLQQLELQHAMTMLEGKNKELEQFAYSASHDLKEPARMINSFLQQLQNKYPDKLDEKAQKYIYYATDGAKRMLLLIDELLAYSKLNNLNDDKEAVNVEKLLDEIVAYQAAVLEECGAKIDFGQLPVIYASRTALKQVFQNLIDNAVKYRKVLVSPVIQITASETSSHWQFAVTDNGIGIENEYFDQIFHIFKRLHAREAFRGTGMGLAICKKIVENNNGRLWVESEMGQGSTFNFTISKNNK